MKIGQDRIVILLPLIGLVVKLPRIRLLAIIREVYRFSVRSLFGKKKEFNRVLLTKFFTRSIAASQAFLGFRALLLSGLITNWSEFIFYVKTRNSFLQPTYFSFFGLLNIQRLGKSLQLTIEEFEPQMVEFINYENYQADSHHFTKRNNFCGHQGKLRILDYGSKVTQKIVRKFGEKIHQNFKLSKT
jgi:hypothetical protein